MRLQIRAGEGHQARDGSPDDREVGSGSENAEKRIEQKIKRGGDLLAHLQFKLNYLDEDDESYQTIMGLVRQWSGVCAMVMQGGGLFSKNLDLFIGEAERIAVSIALAEADEELRKADPEPEFSFIGNPLMFFKWAKKNTTLKYNPINDNQNVWFDAEFISGQLFRDGWLFKIRVKKRKVEIIKSWGARKEVLREEWTETTARLYELLPDFS